MRLAGIDQREIERRKGKRSKYDGARQRRPFKPFHVSFLLTQPAANLTRTPRASNPGGTLLTPPPPAMDGNGGSGMVFIIEYCSQ